LVYLAAVCNARDADDLRSVVDRVHHPPVTGPDAPLVLKTLQFSASRGRGAWLKDSIFLTTRASTLSGSARSSFRADGFTSTE